MHLAASEMTRMVSKMGRGKRKIRSFHFFRPYTLVREERMSASPATRRKWRSADRQCAGAPCSTIGPLLLLLLVSSRFAVNGGDQRDGCMRLAQTSGLPTGDACSSFSRAGICSVQQPFSPSEFSPLDFRRSRV